MRVIKFTFLASQKHTHVNITNSEIEITGYTIERKDRSNGKYGGVLCYIRGRISYQRCYDLEVEGLEIIWLEVFLKNAKSLLFGTAYKPAESSKHIDKKFAEKFDSILSIIAAENKETIIGGDLNCDYLIRRDQLNIKNIIKTSLDNYRPISVLNILSKVVEGIAYMQILNISKKTFSSRHFNTGSIDIVQHNTL